MCRSHTPTLSFVSFSSGFGVSIANNNARQKSKNDITPTMIAHPKDTTIDTNMPSVIAVIFSSSRFIFPYTIRVVAFFCKRNFGVFNRRKCLLDLGLANHLHPINPNHKHQALFCFIVCISTVYV